MHLNVYGGELPEQGQDDVEHLLVMSLRIGIVAVRHGKEVGLEQAEHAVEVFVVETTVHACYCRHTFLAFRPQR